MSITTANCTRSGGAPPIPLERRYEDDPGTAPNVQTKEELLQAARALNAVGWRTFPVKADGLPAVRGYFGSTPYTDRELARIPWDTAVGLGIAEQPGVISLDVDHKDGDRDGYAHLRVLEKACGELPASRRYPTRTGGFHVRYRLPRAAEGLKVRGQLLLPDGADAHIDTIRHEHRFHRVWNTDDWLVPVAELPELPESWLPAILQPAQRPLDAQQASLDRLLDGDRNPTVPVTLEDLIHQVATAEEHTRNNTLNTNYLKACSQGHTDETTRERFAQAALQAGLTSVEITGTLNSARGRAWERWRPVDAWLDQVEAGITERRAGSRSRTQWELMAAEELARLHMDLPPGEWINMSCRRLSERIGVSKAIAARALKRLETWGLITSRRGHARGLSKSYMLNLSNSHFVDTYPFSLQEEDGYVSKNVLFGVIHRPGYEQRWLRSHAAFRRVGEGQVLTPTCAQVLLALTSGPLTRAELCQYLRRSPGAVTMAVKQLESAGWVDYQRRKGVTLRVEGSLVAELDEWMMRMGIDHRPALVRWMHDQDRLAYARQFGMLPPEPDPVVGTENHDVSRR